MWGVVSININVILQDTVASQGSVLYSSALSNYFWHILSILGNAFFFGTKLGNTAVGGRVNRGSQFTSCPMACWQVNLVLMGEYFLNIPNHTKQNSVQYPKATSLHDINTFVCLNPYQGGSKWISASTRGSCSHHWIRGEGALHDPHVLRVASVPSSPQISYLTTITTIHGWTKTQKNPRSVSQISWADASGWSDTAAEAQTSYSQTLSTSAPSYGRHFVKTQLFRDLLCWCRAGLIMALLYGKWS